MQDDKIISIATEAAKKAAQLVMQYYGQVTAEFKDNKFNGGSVVTKADKEAEEIIMNILTKSFPDHNFIGEEGTDIDNGSEYSWYIDPIDGTMNFTRNIPLFSVCLGLLKNNKPYVGVIYFPALNLLFTAQRNKGAFMNGKRISVSKRPIEQAMCHTSFHFENQLKKTGKLLKRVGANKSFGVGSFEFCQVATGDAEIMLHGSMKTHDIAAGACIVLEAGGQITDWQNTEWQANMSQIVVTNTILHKEVISLLNS